MVVCAFGIRTCDAQFAAPEYGSDAQGPYASVRATGRVPSSSGCQDGMALRGSDLTLFEHRG